jgi:hypothetical protein
MLLIILRKKYETKLKVPPIKWKIFPQINRMASSTHRRFSPKNSGGQFPFFGGLINSHSKIILQDLDKN